jgi:type 1 glutamine amidotransferase
MKVAFLASLLLLKSATPADIQPRVLLFYRTTGFVHESIPDARKAMTEIATADGFAVDATDDPAVFTAPSLARYDAVVFLLTTGNVLNGAQRDALQQFVEGGGGFAGVHSAADSEYDSAWYGALLGARFRSHPEIQSATLHVEDAEHPSTSTVPSIWQRTDEWYDFDRSPRGHVHVLLSVDEATYRDGSMNSDHPLAWCNEVGAGRMWYTAMGHTRESYAEPAFRQHLRGGLLFVTRRADADCRSRNGNGSGARHEHNGVATTVPSIALTSGEAGVHHWSGSVMPRFGERYRIEAVGEGALQIVLNGVVVMAATLKQGEAVSTDVDLPAGARLPFVIDYTASSEGANFELRWSSAQQRAETIAAPQLYAPRSRPVRR